MPFLQVNIPVPDTNEFVTRAFDTSPDTVYGLLVAALAIIIIFLGITVGYLFKKYIDLLTVATIGQQATAERLEAIEQILQKQ